MWVAVADVTIRCGDSKPTLTSPTRFMGNLQYNQVFGPRHRYQVMEQILNEASAPEVKWLWSQIKKEELRLWQTWPTGKYTPRMSMG